MIFAPRRSVALFVLFCLISTAPAQDRKRSESFSVPPRDPPSRDFDFLHLRLSCTFDWETESVEAQVTHKARVLKSGTRSVELDAIGIEVRSAAFEGGPPIETESLPDKLRLSFGRELQRGEEITFTISYRASHPRQGVYFQKPDASYPDRPQQVWTQGEAQEARHWIPCFDHPSDKLTSETFVTAPKGMTAISNGRLLSTDARPDGSQVFHWTQEKPHSTYLIVVVVGDFAVWKDEADGIALGGYVQRRQESLAARSFELTGDMMRFFGEKTGVKYPWPKYDQLCVSGFLFGGMENTTATTLNENTLHDERAALDVSSQGLVAHELAHQWFGDLVTCKDWGDIWLNESFATFFENLYAEHRDGWDEGVYERYEQGQSYKGEDRDSYRRRLSTRSWKSPDNLFDRHTYPKGARILNMLRNVVGDSLFFAGVKRYLEQHAFQPVESHDLRVALEEVSGTSLGWFFDEWIFSGGHPEYRIVTDWDERAKSLRVDVEQIQKVDDLTPLFRMPVVIAITQPSGRSEHKVWVSEKKQSFSFPAAERPRMVRFDPGDWILKDVDFQRSNEALVYQLSSDPDVMGRHEAAKALKSVASDSRAEAGLLDRLEREPFWGVRLEIVRALADARGEGVRGALIARFAREPKASVRVEILRVLTAIGGAEVTALLREAFARDLSYAVAAQALRGIGKVEKREAHAVALGALSRESNDDVIREAAVELLSTPELVPEDARKDAVDRLSELLKPGASPSMRGALLRGLGRLGRGQERAFQTLTASLDDSNHFVRSQAAEGLGDLGDRRGLPFLEARLLKERPVALRGPLRAINAAIARLEGRAELKDLQEELRRLREKDTRLEERIESIEKRGRSERL